MGARVFPLFSLLTGLFFLTVGNTIVVGDDCPNKRAKPDYCERFPTMEIPPEEAPYNESCPTSQAGDKCVYGNYYLTYSDYFGCENYNSAARSQCIAEIISIGPPPVLVLKKCADKYTCVYDAKIKHCSRDKDSKVDIMKPVFITIQCKSAQPPGGGD
jgi:hypothetical protein